jgi:DNA-binding FadR family transcriptional regulator
MIAPDEWRVKERLKTGDVYAEDVTDHEREPTKYLVADALRADITGGTKYPPGTRLPSYRGLAAEHGVAPNTVMAAVRMLAAEGLVIVRPSSGAYVRDTQADAGTDAPPLRRDLADVQDHLNHAKRDVAAAERTLTALLNRLPPETVE